jgi:hypothetical protein
MTSLFRLVRIFALVALLPLTASAQSVILGATFNPVSPNGMGFGVQFDVPVYTVQAGDQTLDLAVRAALSSSFSFDLYPNADIGISVRIPSPEATIYAGTGVGLWWSFLDEEPCYDIAWVIFGGIDIPVSEMFAIRVDVQAAPMIGQFIAGAGVAITVGQ